ncbi:SAP30-binding protein-like [Dermacentor variabilis]|uniref:SAP30-binding protein-like n=1 Tax=Dermacentor variabilis TaxID=34621 RepID=UPI003F5B1D00
MTSESSQTATALASLTEAYTDSEDEQGLEPAAVPASAEQKEPISNGIPKSPRAGPLVSYRGDEDDEDTEAGDDEASVAGPSGSKSGSVRPASPVSFHRTLQNLGPNDVVPLPPEPRGRCAPALQEKITRLYQRKLRDHRDMNASIQMRKDFRNPSIYEKLIAYCGIDELGTNYPPEAYDPQMWGSESYYDELSRRQKEEMDKRDKKAKVDFLTGTAKKPDSRKSKWDMGGAQPVLGIVNPSFAAPAALSAKPTVISAFGALPKKNPSTSKQ